MTNRRLLAYVLLLVSSSGCTPGEGEGEADLGGEALPPGVELVKNPAGQRLLASVEDLRLGVPEGAANLQFHRVRSISIASDGRIYVADGGSGQVRVFEGDGEYVSSFGQSGDGPGEYRFVTGVFFQGDTLLVFDGRHRRATMLSTTFELLDTWSTLATDQRRILIGVGAGQYIMQAATQRAGWPYEVGVPLQDTVRIESSKTIPSPDTDFLPITQYAPGRRFGIDSEMAMTANSPLWEPEPDVGVDGRGRVYTHNGLVYVIDVYTPSGEHVRRITREHEAVESSGALAARYHDLAAQYWEADSLQYGEWVISRAAQVDRVALPRMGSIPALGAILVSPDGAFWVERPDLVDDPVLLEWPSGGVQSTFWDVFDTEGILLGTVEFAPDFRPLAVTETTAVGVWRDDLDVEYVVRRSLDSLPNR